MQDITPQIPIAISSLELTNFRLFSQLTVELHPELTVLVAPNAGGKTSVIEALFYHLYLFISGNQLHEKVFNDIKKPSPTRLSIFEIQAIFKINIEPNENSDYKNIFNNFIYYINQKDTHWVSNISDNNFRLEKNKIYELTNYDREARSKLLLEQIRLSSKPSKAQQHLIDYINHSPNNDAQITIPLFSYFSANRRLYGLNNKLKTTTPITITKQDAFKALLQNNEDLVDFDLWLRERAISSLEVRLANEEQGIQEEPEQDAHLKAVSHVLSQMLSSEVNIATVKYFASEKGIKAVNPTGERIDINDLSHGAKSILTIAAQLAMYSCALNPHLRDKAPANTPGIVLIDEIDLHLHPRWQYHVLDDLRRCFPQMQFIVTTHSPAILSTVKREHIRIIDIDNATGNATALMPQSHSYGESIADTLETIMNVPARPQNELVKKIDAYLNWAENGDLTEDKRQERQQLEQALGVDHHDLLSADLIIKRRTILAARRG